MIHAASEDLSVVLGSPEGDHLRLRVLRRTHADCSDYWDGNWLCCTIEVRAGSFSGEVGADLRADEFETFRDALRVLHQQLAGEATFSTMEHWLTVKVVGDGRGHFKADCELREPWEGTRLTFSLDFDQTELPNVVRDMNTVLRTFPVVGRP